MWSWTLGILLLCSTSFGDFMGAELLHAPPAFTVSGKTVVPIDFRVVELSLVLDVTARRARGKSRIEFYAKDAGHPMLDLVPNARAVRLNGVDLGAGGLPEIKSPDGQTELRMVNAPVPAFSNNLLEIEYEVNSSDVTFSASGARLVWAMGDVGADRNFLERYAPSNLEFDPFLMDLDVQVQGGTAAHTVYTNGALTTLASDHWSISFPRYFTTSSFYFHITDRKMPTAQADYKGLNATIPITVYSSSTYMTNSGMSSTKAVLAELEAAYGPFAHERIVVYVQSDGGGMEHVGATITSLGALEHEITHSWFARGVMPAEGNAGWIDEAVASWRDNGYPSRAQSLTGTPVNLASFSKYRRDTPNAAYTSGARLLSGFDTLFPGGLKKVLREIFSQKQRQTVTTPEFEALLTQESGKDVSGYFQRYVYGQSVRPLAFPELHPLGFPEPVLLSRHPRRLTAAEIQRLR